MCLFYVTVPELTCLFYATVPELTCLFLCDSFDLAVQVAVNMNNPSEEWHAFVTEMQGQLFFFAGTLLLKRAQKVLSLQG